MLTLPLPLY